MSAPDPADQPDSKGSTDSAPWMLQKSSEISAGQRQVPLQEWRSATGDLAAFTAAQFDPAGIPTRLVDMFSALPDLQGLVGGPESDPRLPSTTVFAAGLCNNDPLVALLLPPPAEGPLVIRLKCLDTIGGLRDVDAPIWDWLIRASRVNCQIGRRQDWAPTAAPVELPRLAASRPEKSRDWLLEHLESFEPRLSGGQTSNHIASTALRAGMFLWHDYLDESHALAQSIEGEGADRLGDYWHAILHRREPDYSNAKYWFRQISPHPFYRFLRPLADEILSESPAPEAAEWRKRLQPGLAWDPMAFVDLCQKCAEDEDSPLALTARRIQLAEMALLLQRS